MRIITCFFLLLGAALCAPVFSQNAPPVRFEWGAEFFPDNYQAIRQNPAVSPEELVNGHYIRYIQCAEIPNARLRAGLEADGLRFLGYVSFGAYLVAIPADFDLGRLAALSVRSILPVRPDWKLARSLREKPYGDWAVQGDWVEMCLQLYPVLDIPEGAARCRQHGITVVEAGNQNGILHVRLREADLPTVAALPFVRQLELLPPPSEPDDTGGRALHRANLLDSDHPLGNKFDGSGVTVVVRDDGPVGPHIDFRGRNTNIFGPNDFINGIHGDQVAGIFVGAGNLDPTMRGMAAGANLFTIRYRADFQDNTLDLFLDENATITNTSYSNGCNEGYTTTAQTVEQQLHDHPALMHVFSAGNSGTSNCNYGAGPNWGNITGGHKMAKNAIAVANLAPDGTLVNSSSRGPAHDGRLKPDLAANGQGQNSTMPDNSYLTFSGTSAAAPGVAGCMAQLTQAYKTLHNGEQPSAALLKAAMLNTANDLGNPGPDFRFGWGHLNAWRAYRLLAENRWQAFYSEQGSQGLHTIVVPPGTRQARIMLYWTDPPAQVGAARALINDLDLDVLAPDGSTVHLPWLLDPTPNAINLNAPAGKGRDALNNTEQVGIADPTPGTYTVRVRGHEVPMGPQPYYIVWEFDDDRPRLTYPAGGEGLVPGETCRIQWDAYGNDGSFTLQYSPDNGVFWGQIGTAAGDQRMFNWTVPNLVNGTVRIQIIRGALSDTTDLPLTIAPVPANLNVERVCPDSMTVSWAPVRDTLRYDVYLLGEKYMDIVGNIADTVFTFPIQQPGQEKWFSVRAMAPNGLTSRRAVAVNWPGGLKNCQQPDDVALVSLLSPTPQIIGDTIACSPILMPVRVQVANEGLNPVSGALVHYRLNNGSAVTETLPDLAPGTSTEHLFQEPLLFDQNGPSTLQVWTTYAPEDVLFNDTITQAFEITVLPTDQFFTEDFEGPLFPPQGWKILNPDGNITWDRTVTNITGANGQNTRVVFLNCYNYNGRGREDFLYLPPLDLSNLDNPGIVFDLAHANYDNTYRDSLRLEVFPNCDLTAPPVKIWGKAGTALATRPPVLSAYAPNAANDWRLEGASLEDFKGQTVIVRFVSVNDFGNNMFLDNIQLATYFPTPALAQVTASADTLCLLDTVLFSAAAPAPDAYYYWNFGIGAQPTTAVGPGPHPVRYQNTGNKSVRLAVTNPYSVDSTQRNVTVLAPPAADFSWSANFSTVTFTNNSVNGQTFLWNFGDGNTSPAASPVHTYSAPGSYTVTLTAQNACSVSTHSRDFDLTFIGTQAPDEIEQARIVPNPTSGDFRAELTLRRAADAQLLLVDAQGRTVKTARVHLLPGPVAVPFEGLNLPPGVYALSVRTETGVAVFRVVVW